MGSPSERSQSSPPPVLILEQNETDLPVLAACETLNLGLASSFQPDQDCSSLDSNALNFVADPIYPEVVYIYHAFGVHSVSLLPVLEALSLPAGSAQERHCVLQQELSTASLNNPNESLPVSGCALIRDVYLGYSLLMMTNTFQLVARERSLAAEAPIPVLENPVRAVDEGPAYLPLLSRPVFDLPSPFNKPLHNLSQTRFAVPPGESSARITATTLRFLGQTVEKLRSSIRDLTQVNSAVQQRFDTQCKELGRQLGKIAEATQLVEGNEDDLAALEGRLLQATTAQAELVRRLDSTLHRLRQSHVPELSEREKDWFEELSRFQTQVDPDTHGKTLRARLDQARSQLHLLKDQIEQRTTSEEADAGDMGQLGKSQLQRIEAMLAIE
jgi:nucleoporin NUP82